jgi:hypothetical protein
MDLTQLTRDELLALRERVEAAIEARKRPATQAPAPKAPEETASASADLDAFERNLKSELERYEQWLRKHQ